MSGANRARFIEAAATVMVDENPHIACVNAWMDRAAAGLPPERLLRLFEHGFGAMWRRAHQTLGDVTLVAIADRVLYSAKKQFPILSTLEVEPTGLQCDELRVRARSLNRDQLLEGIQFVLVEFLTVLGNLTAEILTAALHSELSKVAPEENDPDDKESQGEPQNPESHDHDEAES